MELLWNHYETSGSYDDPLLFHNVKIQVWVHKGNHSWDYYPFWTIIAPLV
jgi:hypothetical protein